jgi:hypothetical protein
MIVTKTLKLVLRRETLVLLAFTGIASPMPGCGDDGAPDAAVIPDAQSTLPPDASPPSGAGVDASGLPD